MEIHILDMIQNLRTPIGDVVVPLITRLGDAGIIWIILTVLLLIIPKTRKTGVIMLAALLADVLLCNVVIKNLVARTRPYEVIDGLKQYNYWSQSRGITLSRRDTRRLHLLRLRHCILPERRRCGKRLLYLRF